MTYTIDTTGQTLLIRVIRHIQLITNITNKTSQNIMNITQLHQALTKKGCNKNISYTPKKLTGTFIKKYINGFNESITEEYTLQMDSNWCFCSLSCEGSDITFDTPKSLLSYLESSNIISQ